MRSVRTLAPSATRPAEERYGATELPRNFVLRRPPRFGRYAANCIDRGDNTPWGQLGPSFDHCGFVHKIICLHRVPLLDNLASVTVTVSTY
jgi:hypothetical protein